MERIIKQHKVTRNVIFSDGGSPSPEQRKALGKFHEMLNADGVSSRIVIISAVPTVLRVTIMVINVMFAKGRLKIFDSLNEAADRLEISVEEKARISDVAEQLRIARLSKATSASTAVQKRVTERPGSVDLRR